MEMLTLTVDFIICREFLFALLSPGACMLQEAKYIIDALVKKNIFL